MTKQDERVLAYLKRNGSINPIQSWRMLGVYRLSAVIHRLRKYFDIHTERMEIINRWDESCTVARYVFKGAKDGCCESELV